MKKTIQKYCEKKAYKNINALRTNSRVNPICICIPVYNEYPSFFSTLRSLHVSSLTYLAYEKNPVPVSIICCVNARLHDPARIRENNAKMIYELTRIGFREFTDHPVLDLIVLDHSGDNTVFDSNQGVGLARKIAMDYAVLNGAQVLSCLDADTLVSSPYILCLSLFYKKTRINTNEHQPAWALTGFSHQKAETLEAEKAIRSYEKYLNEHSRLLYECGTPYYPIALGPTIVCTAEAYAQCGGMNKRRAGEDFYFLQSLIKLHAEFQGEQVVYLSCCVYPSSRISERVLFGTGKKIQNIINGEISTVFEHHMYEILKKFLLRFHKVLKENPMDFLHEVSFNLPEIMPFLERDGFFKDWQNIYAVHAKSLKNLEHAFHDRFDGLKIIRLFHYLEELRGNSR